VLVGFEENADDDGVQKRGLGDCDFILAKVIADIEFELVRSGCHRRSFQQGFFGSAIGIAYRKSNATALLAETEQTNFNAACRASLAGIKDMCR
jgi:hypothetical protein